MEDNFSNKLALLISRFSKEKKMFSVAESCTGGLLAAMITEIPGVSAVFDRGFVTYSNESKTEMLGVPKGLIGKYGAVSEEVAKSMAEGAIKFSNAIIAVSITGIAGPGGGSQDKPVGLVYIGSAVKGAETITRKFNFEGGRHDIRNRCVQKAIDFLLERLADS